MHYFIWILELVGTVAFAISGALVGLKKQMDVLGVVILGMVTAVGGGVLRDLILGVTPPKTFQNPVWVLVAGGTAVIIFVIFYFRKARHGQKLLDILLLLMDSLGLGIFTVNGIMVATDSGGSYGWVLLIFVGVLTGVGGGVLRDVLAGDRPYIFIKHVYASAAILGAVVYLVCGLFLPRVYGVCLSLLSTVTVRLLSSHFKWNLPKAVL